MLLQCATLDPIYYPNPKARTKSTTVKLRGYLLNPTWTGYSSSRHAGVFLLYYILGPLFFVHCFCYLLPWYSLEGYLPLLLLLSYDFFLGFIGLTAYCCSVLYSIAIVNRQGQFLPFISHGIFSYFSFHSIRSVLFWRTALLLSIAHGQILILISVTVRYLCCGDVPYC